MRAGFTCGLSLIGLLGCSGGAPGRDTDGNPASGGNASGGADVTSGGSVTTGGSTSGGAANGGTSSGGSAGSSGGSSGGSGGEASGGNAGNPSCGGSSAAGGNPATGEVGVWEDVTPDGINLDPGVQDNFGVQDVLVDPARPSDLYTFVCHQGVWKSTDYGSTWAKVNTGTNGDTIDSGKPWGQSIDSNACRDPNTPPTLYSAGSQGQFWKSTDGGVSWASTALPDDGKPRPQDAYNVDTNPYDGKHLLVGFHEQTGLVESTDAGDTWAAIPLTSQMDDGASWYVFFIDTGNAETTRKTWLMISQTTGGVVGTWRTTDAGDSWTQVDANEHVHGNSQVFQRDGYLFMAGVYSALGWGVLRSSDFGATWEHVGSTGGMGVVYGTPNNVYSQSAGASNGVIEQNTAQSAPLPGDSWTTAALPMTNGPKRAATTFDGTHYIIVGGNWNAGIWRYVEPN
jgi:photosystem II stability/assembly factor-like uncharacterized protein